MYDIDPFGHGLSVLIACESNGINNFLAFSCYYSLQKNLPDAKMAIACTRPTDPQVLPFSWVHRLGIPFFYRSHNSFAAKIAHRRGLLSPPILVLPSEIVCLRSMSPNVLASLSEQSKPYTTEDKITLPAKSPEPAVFCSLESGCGHFHPSRWIDMPGHPFSDEYLSLLSRGDLTVNESRVFALWKDMCPLYDTIL